MTTNFDNPILFDDLNTATLDDYLGFGRAAGGETSTGPRIGPLNVNPSAGAGIAAPLGSMILRYDAGNVQIWLKTTAADTGWSQMGTLSAGTIALVDNQANAFSFDEAATPYLRFVTTDTAERLRSAVSWDHGATDGVDVDYDIRNGSATAWEMRAGAGGTVVLGVNTTVAGEGLFSAAAQLVTTAAFQWQIIDATANGLQIGSAGDLDMLVFDTTEGSEVVVVNAANGLRLNDNAELRFGTPGTDLVLTPNGTDVVVSSTGDLRFEDDVDVVFGTTAGSRGNIRYNLAQTRFEVTTHDVAGGAVGTRGLRLHTGSLTVNAAAGGTGSGPIVITTGDSDVTDAGGTSTGTGSLTLETGDAASTAGATSGPTGNVIIRSGNSVDGNSGSIQIVSGTAGGTRGSLDIDVTTIDLTTQGTSLTLIDNTAVAFELLQGTTAYLRVITTDGSEAIEVGIPTAAATTVAPFLRTDGADFGTRMVLVDDMSQRPQLAASIANTNASKTLEIIGTNAADAGSVYATGGGISLATAGAAADQILVRGHTTGADNSQSPWTGTNWSTNDSVTFKANIRVVDTANIRIGAGLKLSLTAGATLLDASTDDDQVWFVYDNPGAGFGANSATNWICHASIATVDTNTDTTVAVAAGNVRFVIAIGSDRVCRFYLNGILRHTTAALTAGVNLLPFVGIQQTAGAVARSVLLQRLGISKLYAA